MSGRRILIHYSPLGNQKATFRRLVRSNLVKLCRANQIILTVSSAFSKMYFCTSVMYCIFVLILFEANITS